MDAAQPDEMGRGLTFDGKRLLDVCERWATRTILPVAAILLQTCTFWSWAQPSACLRLQDLRSAASDTHLLLHGCQRLPSCMSWDFSAWDFLHVRFEMTV